MATPEDEPGYHLLLEAGEIPVAASALRLLVSDEAHEPVIRGLAREVLLHLEAPGDERGRLRLELDAASDEDHPQRHTPPAQRSPARAGR